MPPRPTPPPPGAPRKRWRTRLALAAGLAAAAVLAAMLPAAATGGTIWTTLPGMPTARAAVASATAPCPPGQTGVCVYTVGGETLAGQLASAESYNRITNAWSTLPPMPTARSYAAAASAACPPGQTGTCLYVIGGEVDSGETQTPQTVVQSYNPLTNAWSTVAPMRTARSALAAVAAPCPLGQTGVCVYAVGGAGSSGSLGTTESYNPTTNSWSTLPAMPAPRSSLGAAAAPCSPGQQGTCVYAVGGFDTTQTNVVQSYNPAANTWTPVASLPTPRSDMGTTAGSCPPGQSGTCVYVVGGLYVTHLLASVQSYNPASNLWTDLPPMPTPRLRLGAVAMPCPAGLGGNCVYATGGANGTDVLATLEVLDPPQPTGR